MDKDQEILKGVFGNATHTS